MDAGSCILNLAASQDIKWVFGGTEIDTHAKGGVRGRHVSGLEHIGTEIRRLSACNPF